MRGTRTWAVLAAAALLAAGVVGCAPTATGPAQVGRTWTVEEYLLDTHSDAAVEAALDRPTAPLEFGGIPLGYTIQFIREVSGVPIVVRWGRMLAVGVERTTPANARPGRGPIGQTLETILAEAGGGYVTLDYDVDEGVVVVSTAADIARSFVARVYDVPDLLSRPEPPEAAKAAFRRDLRKLLHEPTRLPGGIFSSPGWPFQVRRRAQMDRVAEAIAGHRAGDRGEKLVRLIKDACGAAQLSAAVFNDRLIIRCARRTHRQVELLLAALRNGAGWDITILRPLLAPPKTPPEPMPPALTRSPKLAPPKQWPAGKQTKTGKPVTLFGRQTSRMYVVFLVDRSGSMLDTFDMVRAELLKAITQLNDKQSFHVIFFASGRPLETPPRQLVHATEAYKREAVRYMKTIQPAGATSLAAGLAAAYAALDVANGSDSQEIYLLTDGEFPDQDAVMAAVRKRQKQVAIPINPVLIWHRDEDAIKSMKALAEATGGRFTFISGEE